VSNLHFLESYFKPLSLLALQRISLFFVTRKYNNKEKERLSVQLPSSWKRGLYLFSTKKNVNPRLFQVSPTLALCFTCLGERTIL